MKGQIMADYNRFFATGQSLIYLDTHIVCRLYEGRIEKLSQTAADTIENGHLFVSPMSGVGTSVSL